MPPTRQIPATTKNATRFGENLLRFDRAFRATSRSMLGSWHSRALRSTGAFSGGGRGHYRCAVLIDSTKADSGSSRHKVDARLLYKPEIMTPDKSKTMDAAEKLMLDLMEKHPGASESSLLALFQNVARERPEVLRAIVGNFMKHSSVQ